MNCLQSTVNCTLLTAYFNYCSLHCIAMYFTSQYNKHTLLQSLHTTCTAIHCTTLQCIVLSFTALQYIETHHNVFHNTKQFSTIYIRARWWIAELLPSALLFLSSIEGSWRIAELEILHFCPPCTVGGRSDRNAYWFLILAITYNIFLGNKTVQQQNKDFHCRSLVERLRYLEFLFEVLI